MAGTTNIFINSDFKDYYDTASSQIRDEKSIIYNRVMKDVPGRMDELKLINNVGMKTVQITPVNRMTPDIKKVVVYTDPQGHRGEGKMLMSLSEANMMYPNKLASEYFESCRDITFKVLNIGKRRFKCIIKNEESLTEKNVVSIDELPSGYNYDVALPIFSIDYVRSNSNEMLVVDFNTVQKLQYLGLESVMTADEVVNEIYGALVAYNKI